MFGIRFDARPIEIVNWKSEAEGPAPDSGVYRLRTPDVATPPTSRPAWDDRSQSFIDHAVIARYALRPGDRGSGPALIEEHESTCVLGVGDELLVDDELNLIIEIRS